MKNVLKLVVGANSLLILVYALGAFRGDAVSVPVVHDSRSAAPASPLVEEIRPTEISTEAALRPMASSVEPERSYAAQSRPDLPPRAVGTLESIDGKTVIDHKEALEPIGELTEAINPHSRPLVPNTEFFGRGILSPANPRNVLPPVVSPEQ